MGIGYAPVSKEYQMRQIAYLMAEGVGINGAYSFKGSLVVEKNRLFVSAKGFTAAKKMGTVNYFLTASILVNGQVTDKKPIKENGPALWAADEYSPIGFAEFSLPNVQLGQEVELMLEGGYIYSVPGVGGAVPLPPTTKTKISLSLIQTL